MKPPDLTILMNEEVVFIFYLSVDCNISAQIGNKLIASPKQMFFEDKKKIKIHSTKATRKKPPKNMVAKKLVIKNWRSRRESNPRPQD